MQICRNGKDATIIHDWIFSIINDGINLTDWEEKFISDMENRNPITLSEKQLGIIESIYTNRVP